jgi:hypothetical protein
VAFGSCLLLFLTAAHEFGFDTFHENRDRIYRLYFQSNTTRGVERSSTMPAPLKPALEKEFPELEYVVRQNGGNCLIRYSDKELSQSIKFTDPDFFRMFTLPLRQGNPQRVLSDLSGTVLNEKLAKKLFADENPVGKQVLMKFADEWQTFTVSGVAADFPDQSSIQYSVLVRFETTPITRVPKTAGTITFT